DIQQTETWFVGTAGGGLFRSTNQGQVWDWLSLPQRQITCLLAMKNGHVFAGTSSGLFISKNGGQRWQAVDQGLPTVAITCLGSDGSAQIFAGTAKHGIFRSTLHNSTSGPTSRDTNSGLFWRQAGLSQWPITSLIVKRRPASGTLSSNGGTVIGNQTRFMTELKPGDGLTIENQTRLIKSIEDDSALTITQPFCPDILPNSSENEASLSPLSSRSEEKSDGLKGTFESTVIIAGTQEGGTFRSKDLGETWERVNKGTTTAQVKALAWVKSFEEDAFEGQVEPILLGTALGSFLYSSDRGDAANWMTKNQGIPQMETYLQILMRLQPSFTASRYGPPGFGQLMRSAPKEILTGAEDGSEMGAFNYLRQPQREANLLTSLDEYLRFGMMANLFYLT
ncbi:MAG: hypothetical protein WBA76_18315, partial [Phormidesmis sp.]